MNNYKKFIKEAYNGKLGLTMCQEWKQKIESEFPELFKKTKYLKTGTYVKILSAKNGAFGADGYTAFKVDEETNVDSGLYKNKYSLIENNCRIWGIGENARVKVLTEEEITQALIKEAEKRGYKEGVNILALIQNEKSNHTIRLTDEKGSYYSDNTFYYGGFLVFYKGKWTEIIQNTITKAEAEKQLNAKIID